MKVKGFIKDVGGIKRIVADRKKAIEEAPTEFKEDEITLMARRLHPGKIKAKLIERVPSSKSSYKLTFQSKDFPLFKAGTYLTIEMKIGKSLITRAYTIASSPLEAYKKGQLSIIVKEYPDGFSCKYLCEEAKVGDEFVLEVGLGQFYIDDFRDNKDIVAIVGGSGITPFIAMGRDIIERDLDKSLTIIYGSDNPDDIVGKEDVEALLKDKRIKLVYVISGEHDYKGEKGFIDKNIIKKYSPEKPTYFICGPKGLYDFVTKELEELGVDRRRIRKESFFLFDASKDPSFPKEVLGKSFKIEVHQGRYVQTIEAKSIESIATSLERAGLRIHTCCRSGECGICRVKVIEGKYYVPLEADKRRAADKDFNYVHSCSTYPLSDLKIKINII